MSFGREGIHGVSRRSANSCFARVQVTRGPKRAAPIAIYSVKLRVHLREIDAASRSCLLRPGRNRRVLVGSYPADAPIGF